MTEARLSTLPAETFLNYSADLATDSVTQRGIVTVFPVRLYFAT